MGQGSETTTSDIADWQKTYFNSGGAAGIKFLMVSLRLTKATA
jgi:hypothetical protein